MFSANDLIVIIRLSFAIIIGYKSLSKYAHCEKQASNIAESGLLSTIS